jgi:hypothetical protein
MYPDCDYSLSVSYVQETVVSYRAQRPSHLWHILALIIPIIVCVIIDLISILALMPMPYYIFPTPLSEPKARRGDVSSAPASLLHLRGLLYCNCVPSAEAQWLHLRHRDPSVLVSEPKARRGDVVCTCVSPPPPWVCCTALCALSRGPVASSQTQRPLCPERRVHTADDCHSALTGGHQLLRLWRDAS